MSTVAQLLDRIYREYLYPPRERPARTPLATGIDDSELDIVYTADILAVEEENALGEATTIEIERELIDVASVVTGTQTITAGDDGRGYLNTAAAAHSAGVDIVISPDYPRQAAFDALNDAIEGLWPDLFRIKTDETTIATGWEPAPADVGEVLGVNYFHYGKWRSAGVKILHGFPDSGTEEAYQFHGGMPGARAYVRYKAVPGRFTAETDDLGDEYQDFYIEPRWEPIVMLDTVAMLVSSVGVDAATQEFITEALAAQGFDAGEGESLRDSLLRFSNFKRAQASKALLRQYRPRMLLNGYAYGDA